MFLKSPVWVLAYKILKIYFRNLLKTCTSLYMRISFSDIPPGFRSLFTRISDKRLSSIQSDFISNMTLDGCASECVTETRFQCKSFSYDNLLRYCFLYSVNLNDRDVHLIDAAGRDHYESKFRQRPCCSCYWWFNSHFTTGLKWYWTEIMLYWKLIIG